ncbi:ABC transporter permease [Leeuwenhoekiella blandensis]|uniref:Putative FtsX-related transmembrane transport protein n=1 Tax=Leeuwenhoekiella blandensis (strain CECT 7118 / CCUG 51940 / KCTC 22103 / MED217) TaxID=398720 RepID=A3XKX0_LEEBM|nr:ABC transporter permease [Leeuwenhoekiella blandensis]EAQ49804.1 putative FtsX-related transmembrane transport protein [Leeuwenhoekiella blandensis MED217]
MLKNYFKIAFRNLWRHKGFSILNIGGLAVGMAAAFLIMLYVGFELSYDTMFPKKERIYMLVSDIKTPSDSYQIPVIDWSVLEKITPRFPEIETSTRIMDLSLSIQKGTENFQEKRSLAADSTFFQIFGIKLLKGNPNEALRAPLSLVLSETGARKYFGSENPIGKRLKIMNGEYTAQVTGVMEDLPHNTQIEADYLLSISTYTQIIDPSLDTSWANYEPRGYVLLAENTNTENLVSKINTYLDEVDGDKMKAANLFVKQDLELITDVYLHSTRIGNGSPNIGKVYIFSLIAVFILLIAGINFINLTTARSVERAKEVGIRKVVGAQKKQLMLQFVGESLIVTLLAFFLGIAIATLALPYFNALAGQTVASGIFINWSYIALFFGIALAMGLAAGTYPALVLSSFRPVSVLKGKFSTTRSGAFLRKGLVVGQFSLSIVLIIGTLVMYNQMHFMQNQDLGFVKDRLLILDTDNDPKQQLLSDHLKTNPNIISIGKASTVPGGGGNKSSALSLMENSQGQDQTLTADRYIIDENYLDQLDIKLLAGRNFSRELASDSTQAIIVNEKVVDLLGYANAEEAIGASFDQWGRNGQIIGVVENFHAESLKREIGPLSFVFDPKQSRLLTLKVAATDLSRTLNFVEDSWKQFLPNTRFEYYFLDEFFDRQYRSEQRFNNLFLSFAVLAIFISCLGLLGLASYSTKQRRREIGIRKIVGASVPGIVNLLSKEFIKLVGIAFLIAVPVAWFGMHKWLQDFAYRIELSWWIFALAGLLAIGIAMLTVSFQAIKAAIANPVKAIRTE